MGGRFKSVALRGLHLGALWAAAFAQPLFDVLENNAAFFAIRGSEPVDIVVFAVALITVVPLVLVALEVLVGLFSATASGLLHLVFVGGLVALLCLQILVDVSPGTSGAVLVPAALAAGALGAVAYRRLDLVRTFMTVVSPAPLLFLVAFLFFSPVTKLIFDGDDGAALASGVNTRAPIVVVIFDQLPLASLLAQDGRIDPERYPNFAALAEDSYWFRNAASTSSQTELAIPAILTGNRPGASDVPTLQDNPRNLFTLFGASHSVHATEATSHLCPTDLCSVRTPGFGSRMRSLTSDLWVVGRHMVLPEDMRRGLPSIAYQWQDFGKDEAADEGATNLERLAAAQRAFDGRREVFSAFVRSIGRDDTGRPPLHFLHSMVPHYPFEYLPSGRHYGNIEQLPGLEGLKWTDDPRTLARGYQRHLLQVGFVDRLVGQLVRRLKDTGMYDDSLIVITADHGATFKPDHPLLGWSGRGLPTILPVPVLIKAPEQRKGRTVDADIQTVDILPTMTDLLGMKPPWGFDGRSALAPAADRRTGILHRPGERPLPFTFAASHAALDDALREKTALFGAGNGFDGLFGIGPRPELLGRRVDELPAAPAGGLRANLDQPELLVTVDPRSEFVPAHLTGSVTGPGADAPKDLAFAVDGVVEATARSVRTPGSEDLRFSVIVPEQPLLRGARRVQVLWVTPGGELAPIASVRSQAGRYTLRGDELRAADGEVIPIDDRLVTANREQTEAKEGTTRFGGWAFRTRDGRPVDRVLAFAGDRLVHAGSPSLDRPDVADAYSIEPTRLGFDFALDSSLVRQAGGRIRIFVVVGGTAAEI